MNRPIKLVVTVIVCGLSVGAWAHLAKLHGQPLRTASLNGGHARPGGFPGYASPEDTLQSLGWAADRGNVGLIEQGVTSELQEKVHAHLGADAASHASGVASLLGSARILSKETSDAGEVWLRIQPAGYEVPWRVRMLKTGEEWKLAGIEH